MNHLRTLLVVASSAILLSACRTQAILVPEAQVETPEVAGQTGAWGLRADVTPARSVSPVRHPEDHPPDTRLRT